jgi:outer membrane protein OmpA-like peptidoglycan-associated protein
MFREARTRRLATGASAALVLAAFASCDHSGTGDHCAYENWRGMCQLKEINRTRLIESMPAIAVVEAVYEPQPAASGPVLLPPSKRQEFSVRAEQEPELRAHLQKYPLVECQFQELRASACAEGNLALSVPTFIPPEAPTASVDAGDVGGGCSELDKSAAPAQGSDAELPQGVPVELMFEADSSEPTAQLEQQVAQVAQALQQHPDIECLAVVGHVTAGERAIVGDERAAAVKNLLVARGIASKRLQTIAAVVPMSGGAPRAVIPADRKVRLRVLRRGR